MRLFVGRMLGVAYAMQQRFFDNLDHRQYDDEKNFGNQWCIDGQNFFHAHEDKKEGVED